MTPMIEDIWYYLIFKTILGGKDTTVFLDAPF